jgi:hypothetical protein
MLSPNERGGLRAAPFVFVNELLSAPDYCNPPNTSFAQQTDHMNVASDIPFFLSLLPKQGIDCEDFWYIVSRVTLFV